MAAAAAAAAVVLVVVVVLEDEVVVVMVGLVLVVGAVVSGPDAASSIVRKRGFSESSRVASCIGRMQRVHLNSLLVEVLKNGVVREQRAVTGLP